MRFYHALYYIRGCPKETGLSNVLEGDYDEEDLAGAVLAEDASNKDEQEGRLSELFSDDTKQLEVSLNSKKKVEIAEMCSIDYKGRAQRAYYVRGLLCTSYLIAA